MAVLVAMAACVGWLVFGGQYAHSDWDMLRVAALMLFAGGSVYWMRTAWAGLSEPLIINSMATLHEATAGDSSFPLQIAPSESSTDTGWICDGDGSLEFLNGRRMPAGRSLLDEIASLILPEDFKKFQEAWQRSLNHSRGLRCEVRLGSEPDSCRWHLAHAQAVCDEHGRIVRWHGAFTDIDEYKRLGSLLIAERQRADDADQAKKAFLASTSHEIRTTMNALLGMADMLWESELSDAQRHYVEVFRQAGGSLFQLINDTLDVSKPEPGDRCLQKVSFEALPTKPPVKKTVKAASKIRILVAEDSEDNRFLLQAYCHGTAYELAFVEDGARAVAAYQADTFELIVMDVQMPVMDGLAATREIRNIEASRSGRRTPILALTANVLPQDVTRAREAGCDTHLAKPISKKSFLAGIEQWLATSIAA